MNSSIKNGLDVAAAMGLPSLQADAGKLLENAFRSGKCDGSSSDRLWKVRFGSVQRKDKASLTSATILGRPWAIMDYGDTIPGVRADPINDVFGEATHARNQRLAAHLTAGGVHLQTDNASERNHAQVTKRSRQVRRGQYGPAKTCQSEIGPGLWNCEHARMML